MLPEIRVPLVDPRSDLLRALDEHLFARRGPVHDAAVLVPAAAGRLDPFAIRPGVNRNRVPGLCDGRRLADRQEGAFQAARILIVSRLRNVHLPPRRAAGHHDHHGNGSCEHDGFDSGGVGHNRASFRKSG